MASTDNTHRFLLKAVICKVFVCGLWHQPLCHLFTSWICTAHTHIHTHPPFSQHTARTQTPMPQTHSHAHKHTCLFHFPHARELLPGPGRPDACSRSTRGHAGTLTVSPAGSRQAGPVHTWTGRAGNIFQLPTAIDMQDLSCLSFFALGFDWVECQSLLAQSPERQPSSNCPEGGSLPEPEMDVCQLWKGHQGKRPP